MLSIYMGTELARTGCLGGEGEDVNERADNLQCPNVRGPADEDRKTSDSDSLVSALRLITGPIGLRIP